MSAWRSFLSRPHHLLSRLRPSSRSDASQLPPVRGNSHLMSSRRYSSNGDSHAEVKRQHPSAHETTKRHLYVVLDDHKDSYGIHKLDMDGDDLDHSSPRSFPVLPALSVAHATLSERAKFAAVGSSIIAIGRNPEGSSSEGDGRVLIYDTKTAEMFVSPQLQKGLEYGCEAAMAVGQRLYFLEPISALHTLHCEVNPLGEYKGGLHCLAGDPDFDLRGGKQWRPLSTSMSQWSWNADDRLLGVPFRANTITAHAVHAPPAAVHHDIYVSALVDHVMPKGVTFSFSTASGEWTRRGYWQLPFIGHAHYDDRLGAWLGLHASNERSIHCPRLIDGHLCAGNITSPPPEWKLGRDKLFHRDEDMAAGWRHFDAKLVPMAPGNEYCLMERLRPEGDANASFGDGDKWLLRLTTFLVERGHDGEPAVTARRPARCYKMSRYNKYFDAQAFWM